MPEKQTEHSLDSKTIFLIILLPLVAGIILASFIPRPKIGIIEINEAIEDANAQQIIEQIQYAYNHKDIHAVVLILDSPGGTINDTELIYLELNHLRQKKPVVAMVKGLSASGSFYISMATDYIYSNPSALVGNVGVIAQLPSIPMLYEEVYSSGPYKFWGSARDTYVRQVDMMKETFLEAVLLGRGENLKVPEDVILRGEIYPANEALQYGLIDELGSQSDANEKAAKLARIANYETINLADSVERELDEASNFYALDENGEITGYPKEAGFYYLYIADVKGGLK